ncbi:hypothetical protein B4135_4101 [Caldibacillus debilis]|jgi:SprT-like protein|uniref:Protein SprT-like n=2 Tax=Caldibacillus debilis TaxID=301148 RepID=A0A150L7X0_9BACI|nr:hypothetical protein B4135_4101 [Caldibacillus debilis]
MGMERQDKEFECFMEENVSAPMDDERLQRLTEEISLKFFSRPFLHRATFNPRLRTTGGRYLLASGNIEINKKYFDAHGMPELIGIIKHELCHYHLHQTGKGFRHKDKDFKRLIEKVGAPRYCTPLPGQGAAGKPEKIHLYRCSRCGALYRRKRRINTEKFVCGRCLGKLVACRA